MHPFNIIRNVSGKYETRTCAYIPVFTDGNSVDCINFFLKTPYFPTYCLFSIHIYCCLGNELPKALGIEILLHPNTQGFAVFWLYNIQS